MSAGVPGADPRRRRGATRGFLFADLRGYTAFLERRGANDAAALLDRYRALVRTAVDQHDGAEIRTEGDSFYVVFPDASGAVACGLAIARDVADATAADPQLPILVGIGVHAGETVETSEGYVGSAVNLAARLCSAAPAGEVLVSDTVRALTSGVAPVRFEPRGRRRFKGITDPVTIYRVVDEGAAPSPARRPRWVMVVGAAAALTAAVVVVALIGGALTREGLGGGTPASNSPQGSTPQHSQDPSSAPEPTDGALTATEEALLALVQEEFHASCEPTPESAIPRYSETRNDVVGPQLWPIEIRAGIVCSPFGLEAPDELGIWDVKEDILGLNATDVIYNMSGVRGASEGPCDGELPAAEPWSAGPLSGRRLCLGGEHAVIYWTHDGEDIIGRAARHDGDMDALLRWWTAEARLREPAR